MQRRQALYPFRSLLTEAGRLATSLSFSPHNRQHAIATSLLGSVLEQAQGILLTLEQENGTCAFILLRSAVEATVDLCNITNDSNYGYFMHAALLDQQRRVIESSRNRGSTSAFLRLLAQDQSLDAHLTWLLTELAALKQRGFQPLRIKDRFELANGLDLYEGPYASLCWHTHNNLNILERRHIVIQDDQLEVRIFQPPTDADFQLILSTTAHLIANSVATVKANIEGSPPNGLETLYGTLGDLSAVLS